MLRKLCGLALLLVASLAALPASAATRANRPIEVRVVIVTTWEAVIGGKDRFGELQAWETRWPLPAELPFPAGVHPLRYDPKSHVLAVVTGVATARGAASIMALGLDPRFDVSHAYWIVAGVAGVDPKVASVGSAAWARWVVDGDLAQEIDSREAPADWPTGVVPYHRATPYEPPTPPIHSSDANMAYELNAALVDWAYAQTKDTALPDDRTLRDLRAPYDGEAARPPFVLEGDGLMSARFWYGARLNEWARRWVDYWTGGKGVFVMSAEEDTGIMQGLTQLAQAGRARLDRVLILRTASDYTVGPPGMGAAEFLARENKQGYPGTQAALNSLYLVAAPVAHRLADDWAQTRDSVPGGQAPK